MNPLYHAKKSDGRWFVRAVAFLIIGFPAVAQQTNVSAPLSANEVMGRVVQMNELRAKAVESYSSVRTYHLECHCLSHKKADMVVRTDYHAPNRKEFTLTQLRSAPPRFENNAQETASTKTSRFGFSDLTRRLIQ